MFGLRGECVWEVLGLVSHSRVSRYNTVYISDSMQVNRDIETCATETNLFTNTLHTQMPDVIAVPCFTPSDGVGVLRNSLPNHNLRSLLIVKMSVPSIQ